MFAAVCFLPPVLNDNDTYWQIATGGWILDHHRIPHTDPFSYTAGDRHWFAHEWLAETLMALAYRGGGLRGVMVLTGLAAGLTAAVLMHHLRRALLALYATAGLALAFHCMGPSLLARPHLLAWPCLALWCGGLVQARSHGRAPGFGLLPVMLIWVNLHGSFMLGLLLPVAFMTEALIEPGARRGQVFAGWLTFIAAAWATALINPDFVAGLLFPIHLIGMSSLANIVEWRPPDFARLQPVQVMIYGCLALGLSGRLQLPPVRLVMLLGLVHISMAHGRNQPVLGILAALILAEPLGSWLKRAPANPPAPAGPRLTALATAVTVAALCVRFIVPLGPARSEEAFTAVLQQVPPPLRATPVLNDYFLGGQLILAGARPFIDGRTDLYGDAFMQNFAAITHLDQTAFDRTVATYDIGWTLFPADAPIIRMLDLEPGWHRVVSDGGLVVHARNHGPPAR